MGCLFSFFFRPSASADIVEPPRQVFSWEREDRKAIRIEDFMLNELRDQTIFRLPGSVNGQQFIIQKCDNCTVYVFDHTAQIQVDDCKNCRIFIGAVHGSFFIRDCTNCVVATACQQFRTRDCRDLHVFLSCISQPIIESSFNVKFACLTINYQSFADQCKTAGVIPWNNNWGNIHDFTPMSEGKNYSLLDQNEILSKYLPIPTDPSVSHLNIDDSQENSVTPFTYGELFQNRNDERCFVVFFHDERADPCARDLIKMLKQTDIVLVQSKSYVVDENSAERLFNGSKNYTSQVNKGPALGLEFAGMNAVQLCQQSLHNLITSKYSNLSHFISQTPADAKKQLNIFYNFASMQMFA